jgi:hypothetical protein
VPSVPLSDLLLRNAISRVDLVSIDTEGTELEAWRTIGSYRPSVVIMELVTYKQRDRSIEYVQALHEDGYTLKHRTDFNGIFTVRPKIAVLIKSARTYRAARHACDITWAAALRRAGVPVYYVEGGYDRRIVSSDGDGLIGVNTPDDRWNLTPKLRAGVATMLSIEQGWEYLMVVDDDTFVHPERLLKYRPKAELECRVFTPKTQEHKRINKGRPWVTGGPGWVMTRDVCQRFAASKGSDGKADDVYIASFVDELTHRPDVFGSDKYTGHNDRVSPDNGLITCHHVSPMEMVELYERNMANGGVL